MTKYENSVRNEIEEWKNYKEGILTKLFNAVTSPITWVVDKVVPDAVTKTIGKAVMGFFDMLKDASYWTFSDKSIISKANNIGISIIDCKELKHRDIKDLDKLAQKFFTSNKIMAALEGAGTGLGGLVLIAADIPLLFGLCFRAIQQIGTCYGFDMEDPKMSMVVMSCLNVGLVTSAAAKSAALADMAITAEALMKNWTYKKIAETTQTGAFVQALKNITKKLPPKIAENITKKKLAQLIPILGGVVGAGFNYWYLKNVTTTSYMIFRELYLMEKYNNIKVNN